MISLLYITLKDIATTYSGLTVIVLGMIFYFIKRRYDLQSKKNETLHTMFHQNKITALTYYFSAYIHMDKLVHKLVVDNSISISPGLEQELNSATENFKVALTQLNLYLSPLEMNEYRKLYMNMEGIWPNIEKIKGSKNEAEARDNSEVLLKYLNHYLLENATVIELIGQNTRKMFFS